MLITEVRFHSAKAQNTPDSTFTTASKADSVKVIPLKKGDLESKVEYTARDSMRFDVINQKMYLFGEAEVVYEDINLKAGYIELSLKDNIVYAEGRKDSLGQLVETPVFSQADQTFEAKKMMYNYETKKGRIIEVLTKESDGYIHGETVKKDTSNIYYIKNGRYTTCENKNPHFYIKADKLKIIPDDKIITGPANLVIMDIPTPLALPFGMFPNKKGQKSGILIPFYGDSPGLGFFLRDGGYYFGINDRVDLALRGDIYSRGSWGLKAQSNYAKRYKYNGNINLSYSNILLGEKDLGGTVNKDFFVRWDHNQDGKARPGSRFSANVNAGSSNFNKYNSYVPVNYLSNTFQSNISYSKSFLGTPFSTSANIRHSQNTINKQVDLGLPELTFVMNRIYPFKRKNAVSQKWYDKIGLSYTNNFRNSLTTVDSLLFKRESLDKMKNGMRHTVPINTTFNLFKVLTVTPSINLGSSMYIKSVQKRYDKATNTIVIDTLNGFVASYDYSLSTTVTSQLFGMYQFKSGPVKAIRHVMTPSAGYSYKPDFSESQYGFYKRVALDSLGDLYQDYSIFEQGIFGGPSAGESSSLFFSLNNNLEAKLKSRKDTVSGERKVMIIDAFNISTSYNMAAKHYKLSNIGLNGRTTLFKVLSINGTASVDPYRLDSAGNRIERWEWTTNKRVGRITSANLAVGTSLRGGKLAANQTNNNNKTGIPELDYIMRHPDAYVDFNVPWSLSINYNMTYTDIRRDKTYSHGLNFNGELNVTKKWKIGFNSGYDFKTEKLTYTQINVYRDLHCWDLKINWIPFGFRQSYAIEINVKSSTLQDLKLTRKRDWFDYR